MRKITVNVGTAGYEAFLARVKTLNVALGNHIIRDYRNTAKTGDYIKESWTTGGLSGGSCWDDGETDNHYAVEGNREPELTDIFTIMEAFCPDLSFLNARKLMGLIKYDSYTDNEYYGNYFHYGVKYVDLRELYDAFVDLGVL
jgi:hypothetical protein